jgi:hypothetical protein
VSQSLKCPPPPCNKYNTGYEELFFLYESGSTIAAIYVLFIATLGISIESTVAEKLIRLLPRRRTIK